LDAVKEKPQAIKYPPRKSPSI